MLSINKGSSFYYIYNKLFPHELASNANNWAIKPYFLSVYNGFYKEEKNKYHHLDMFINGIFYNGDLKNEIFTNFCTCQKIYMGFLKLYNVYKWKKAKYYDIDYDFHGNLFKDQQSKYLIKILENKKIYVFKIHDLLNIIRHDLSNIFMPEYLVLFQEPKQTKNPYTNIVFNKSTLYNIYFFLKSLPYFQYQELFEKFFKSDFNIKLYGIHYDYESREEAIRNYLKNLTIQEYFEGIKKMCKDYSNILDKKKWVHSNFPKEKFVEAYKPFFIVHIFSKLTLSNTKYNFYNHYLLVKLKQFIKTNHSFGREYIKFISKTEYINGKFITKKIRKKIYSTEYVALKDLSKKKNKRKSNFFEVEQDQILNDISLQQINMTASVPDSDIYRRQRLQNNDIMYDYDSDYYSDSDTESDTQSDSVSQNGVVDDQDITNEINNEEFIEVLEEEQDFNTNSIENLINTTINDVNNSFQQNNQDNIDVSLFTGLNNLTLDVINNEREMLEEGEVNENYVETSDL
tara:strand:+ start:959 stop:2500 length:1542 start_codon:yes stop_codon:yes gene_type:complete